MIPLFTSHTSIGSSILTLEEAEDVINTEFPVSIFTIAKAAKLNEIFLVEKSMGGFLTAIKSSQKCKIPIRFGLKVVVCSDMNQKTEESLTTESKVIIWMKNSDAYKDLIKIYTKSYKNGFYYQNRLDWNTLNSMWTKNLILSIPFYDSFLHNNLVIYNASIVPKIENLNPNILIENHNLPFDPMIEKAARGFAEANKLKTINTHSIYYYDSNAFKSYIVYRAIHNRAKFERPQIDHLASNAFSWESYSK